MTLLRPLKTVELRDIFATLDRGNKGFVDASDLGHAYSLLGSDQKELDFALEHLVKVGGSQLSSGLAGDGNAAHTRPDRIELATFVDAVNHVLATNSLEVLLKATFERLAAYKDSNSNGSQTQKRVKVPALMELASKFGLKMSKDSEIRLKARVPDEGLDFAGFVDLIATT